MIVRMYSVSNTRETEGGERLGKREVPTRLGFSDVLRVLLLVLLPLSLALSRLAAVSPSLAVPGAGLGRRQGLHPQDLVDLPERQQPQRMLTSQPKTKQKNKRGRNR